MRRPLKDVDVVAVLPVALRERYFTPNGARMVHEAFKPVLAATFGDHVAFDVGASAGKALQLCFDDVDFTVDLVAAVI